MKTERLAIIGGAGPLASSLMYNCILKELYREKKEIYEMVIFNYPFTPPHACEDLSKYDDILLKELQSCVEDILSLKIKKAIVVCNTLHSYLDKIKGDLSFIHLPKLVMEEICSNKLKKILVLGTTITINNGLYRHKSYDCVYPVEKDQLFVNQVIENVLNGKVLKIDGKILEYLILKIQKKEKIDAVVLGCTELPVLHHHFPLKLGCQIFDPIKIFSKQNIEEVGL
jgi:aspartate racemase